MKTARTSQDLVKELMKTAKRANKAAIVFHHDDGLNFVFAKPIEKVSPRAQIKNQLKTGGIPIGIIGTIKDIDPRPKVLFKALEQCTEEDMGRIFAAFENLCVKEGMDFQIAVKKEA